MITVIYGPEASGKTTNASAFKRHYGARRVVDSWSVRHPRNPQKPCAGDLVLSTDGCDALQTHFGASARIISIEDAKAQAGINAPR